jgi:hypothetical protein
MQHEVAIKRLCRLAIIFLTMALIFGIIGLFTRHDYPDISHNALLVAGIWAIPMAISGGYSVTLSLWALFANQFSNWRAFRKLTDHPERQTKTSVSKNGEYLFEGNKPPAPPSSVSEDKL